MGYPHLRSHWGFTWLLCLEQSPKGGFLPSSTSNAQQSEKHKNPELSLLCLPLGGHFMYLLSRNRAWESWAPIKFLLHCTACQGILRAGNCRASTLSSQAQPGFKLFLVDICICIALELQPCCPNAAPSVSLYRALTLVSNLEMSCASHAAEIQIDYQISKRYQRSERGKKSAEP